MTKVVSGEEFNQWMEKSGTKYYKLIKRDKIHNGLRIKKGLNIDPLPFNERFCENGLHFTDQQNLPYWLCYNKETMRFISLVLPFPVDAKILVPAVVPLPVDAKNPVKYKATVLNLGELTWIDESDLFRNVENHKA
jgi:hypothetical protein